MKRVLFLLLLGVAAQVPAAASAQAPGDSIAAWTHRLRTGRLVERLIAAEDLAGERPESLPAATRDVVLHAFLQLNEELRSPLPLPGIEELVDEDLGEYYFALASMVYAFDTPEARLALARSAGGSMGLLRRIAKEGDAVVPILAERIRDGYAAGDALETMALAWFWADSTGAPLSTQSRQVIANALTQAVRDTSYDLRASVPLALLRLNDPVFLPLAHLLAGDVRTDDDRLIRGHLTRETIPALVALLHGTSPGDYANRLSRLVDAFCYGVSRGPKLGACQAIINQLSAARGHIAAGRAGPAKETLTSIIARADQARASGAFSSDEHALIAGGATTLRAKL